MKAPWILIWALASVPVFAQEPFSTGDRGAAFDVILNFVDDTTAQELRDSRSAVDAARQELAALRDAETRDEGAISDARENLVSLRRELSDQLRVEIGANEDLQAELRSLVQEARQDQIETVAAVRDENFDAVLGAATDEQALVLVDNRDAIEVLAGDLRSLRDDGATRDDLGDQVEVLRTLQREQRELVSDIVAANDDLRADLQRDGRETRRDTRRDFLRDSNDGFLRDSTDGSLRDRFDGRFGDQPTTDPNGG